MVEPIYPDEIVPLDDPFSRHGSENGGSKIRLDEIKRIRNKLEKDIDARKRLYKGYKRFFNGLHGVSIGTTSVATALAGVTLGVMSNPTTVLPLAITNVTLGTIGAITGIWSKLVRKRVDKHQRIYLIASETLQNINELLSESLKDSHVSDKEFKMVLDTYQRYLLDIKLTNDTFGKRNLVEKEQVMKKLSETFSK